MPLYNYVKISLSYIYVRGKKNDILKCIDTYYKIHYSKLYLLKFVV